MKKITVNKTRILTAAVTLLAAVCCLAGCGSNAVQEVPQPAGTSRSEEATPETAAPEATATPAPTQEPTPAVVVPTSVTLEQEGGILNNGMTWTLHATVLPEDAADKTITWTSADESVATIDDSGVITTHAPGQTTITAASTAGGVSTTYNLVVQEVVKCSYCGGTGHTADTCAVKKTAEQQAAAVAAQQQAAAQAAAAQAAEQSAAEAAQPADPGYVEFLANATVTFCANQGNAQPETFSACMCITSKYIEMQGNDITFWEVSHVSFAENQEKAVLSLRKKDPTCKEIPLPAAE